MAGAGTDWRGPVVSPARPRRHPLLHRTACGGPAGAAAGAGAGAGALGKGGHRLLVAARGQGMGWLDSAVGDAIGWIWGIGGQPHSLHSPPPVCTTRRRGHGDARRYLPSSGARRETATRARRATGRAMQASLYHCITGGDIREDARYRRAGARAGRRIEAH